MHANEQHQENSRDAYNKFSPDSDSQKIAHRITVYIYKLIFSKAPQK
jgi:hypothetical protein